MTGPLPCPFCGRVPIVHLGKKGHCQLHGDPYQAVVVACRTSDCSAKPSVAAGDLYNGGEAKAKKEAIALWNRRPVIKLDPFGITKPGENVVIDQSQGIDNG